MLKIFLALSGLHFSRLFEINDDLCHISVNKIVRKEEEAVK